MAEVPRSKKKSDGSFTGWLVCFQLENGPGIPNLKKNFKSMVDCAKGLNSIQNTEKSVTI